MKHPCATGLFDVVTGMPSRPNPKKHSGMKLPLKSVEIMCLDVSNDLGLSLHSLDIMYAQSVSPACETERLREHFFTPQRHC